MFIMYQQHPIAKVGTPMMSAYSKASSEIAGLNSEVCSGQKLAYSRNTMITDDPESHRQGKIARSLPFLMAASPQWMVSKHGLAWTIWFPTPIS